MCGFRYATHQAPPSPAVHRRQRQGLPSDPFPSTLSCRRPQAEHTLCTHLVHRQATAHHLLQAGSQAATASRDRPKKKKNEKKTHTLSKSHSKTRISTICHDQTYQVKKKKKVRVVRKKKKTHTQTHAQQKHNKISHEKRYVVRTHVLRERKKGDIAVYVSVLIYSQVQPQYLRYGRYEVLLTWYGF